MPHGSAQRWHEKPAEWHDRARRWHETPPDWHHPARLIADDRCVQSRSADPRKQWDAERARLITHLPARMTPMNATATQRAPIVSAAMPAAKAAATASAANASASHLSSAKYGYDLVCATTQDAVNATMKRFLSAYAGQEFSACYVYDANTKQTVEMPLADIVAKIGGDPFAIPNGDATNPLVVSLYKDCKFRFAFRAKIGTPSGVKPGALPDIVRLDKGNSLVTYQLYCAEFEVLNLENNFGDISWSNLSQPAAQPWIFQFTVNLDLEGVDFRTLPDPVKQKVKDLNPNTAFSVQQLYLDLNTAGLESMPTIQGLDPSSDAYVFLTKSFINTYWYLLKQGKQGAILGYAVKPTTVNSSTPSIVPTDLTIEISPYLNSQGGPTGQYGLYTINFLVMSKNAPMPAAVPFEWNWVDQSEEADFDGVMAIRRDIYVDYLKGVADQEILQSGLSLETYVELTHSGDDYTITYGYRSAGTVATFQEQPAGQAPGADGYTSILTLSFGNSSHDDSEAADHLSSIHGDFNYSLSGDVAVKDDLFRVTLTAVVYAQFNIHEAGIRYGIVDGNALNYTTTTTYQLVGTPDGKVHVIPTTTPSGGPQSLDYGHHGIVNTDDIRDMITNVANQVSALAQNKMSGYGKGLSDLVNGSYCWVFPGGTTFTYKQLGFSKYQDLLARVTYVDPA
jgi:hypothetical protein